MNKVYEAALKTYIEKRSGAENARNEKRNLFNQANDAVIKAEAALEAALKTEDRKAYKKALAEKTEAEADAKYYKELLAKPETTTETEKGNYKKILAELEQERAEKRREYEEQIFIKFCDLFRYVGECQNELKALYAAKTAYKKDLLKNETLESWTPAELPQNALSIFQAARKLTAIYPNRADQIQAIERATEESGKAELTKWGAERI